MYSIELIGYALLTVLVLVIMFAIMTDERMKK